MFLFKLALRLGRTVQELEDTLSYAELMQWIELATFDPFDEERADLRNAMSMALTANLNRDKKKRSTPFSPTDFMPFHNVVARVPATTSGGRPAVKMDPKLLTYFFTMSKTAK